MEKYFLMLVVLGSAMLGMAWIPSLTKRFKVSYSILYLLFGIAVYSLTDVLPLPNPMRHEAATVRLTELMVIVSLMGTGLKIDESFSIKAWRSPLRLISVTMIASIALVAFLAHTMLDFDIPSSILIGAVLAPTDPVLADDVQVGPPLEKTRNKVRFTLTAEAGLNDGMAFPFTWLAVAVALHGVSTQSLVDWITYDLLYRVLAGLAMGFAFGKILGYLVFTLPGKMEFLIVRDGFVAIPTTILAYGATELIHGYGFVAVFICAITLRNYELEHKYHTKLHSFTDQIERMLMAIVLILFGGTLYHYVFSEITWPAALFAILTVLVIRPLTAYFVLPSDLHIKERAAISFYGIKGIGSFFYLSFALLHASFAHVEELWVTVSLVVLLSILVHGFSARSIMLRIEDEFAEEAPHN